MIKGFRTTAQKGHLHMRESPADLVLHTLHVFVPINDINKKNVKNKIVSDQIARGAA